MLNINRNFNKEINLMLDMQVRVVLREKDRYFSGKLTGYDITSGTITLSNVVDHKGAKFTKIVLHGASWNLIFQTEKPFPMEELKDRIAQIFPTGQVKFDENSNTINILNGKIIVNENGVQGNGPTAARVSKLFEEFMDGMKK
jgi:small nuclear ribonucleoprotein (snRNP)-like protein